MKLLVKKGSTSVLACIFIQDSSSTVGAGLSGLVFNTSGLVCYRARADDGNAGGTAISLATATLGTWATGGFKEKDATNMKGVYEIGITNASLVTGSDYCILYFSGATNMAPLVLEIQIVAFDPDDAVHLGLSSLPNTAVTTNASLLTSGTGTDQISNTGGGVNMAQIAGNSTAASQVSKTNQAIVRGTVGSGSTTTSIVLSAIASPASLGATGQLIGRTIIFDANTTTGNLQSQATNITNSTTGATPTLTVTALTTAPVSGDTFSIV